MELKTVDEGQSFDFGKTAAHYAAYRDIYPSELYERLRVLGVAADDSSWLDLGTGTGVLPKNLYTPRAKITGADISPEQIGFAKREAAENGMKIDYLVSPAESTGLPDHTFDAITAAQCFWYFDRKKMRSEISRLLRPGGVFIKIFMTWDPDDPIASESVGLVKKYNPLWSGGGEAYRDVFDDLFEGRMTVLFDSDIPFTRASWHGRMLACRGTLASMTEDMLRAWEAEHIEMLEKRPESFTIRHETFYSVFWL